MSISAKLIAFRLRSFNCRTTAEILIHIKYEIIRELENLDQDKNLSKVKDYVTKNYCTSK